MRSFSLATCFLACLFVAACTCEPIFSPDASFFACTSHEQCATGFVCREALCQPVGTPVDAGDACVEGACDAGISLDAGADAGTDAGVDAGLVDAGFDAGVDAGIDAGPFDSGLPDAGPPFDAGPAWTPVDIGTFTRAGTVNYSGNRITVSMQAGDIWGDVDDFYFLYQMRTGDLTMTAQVFSLDAGSEWGKAGVMVRQALTRESPNALVMMTREHGYGFQVRDAGASFTGPGASDFFQPEHAPYWVRLVRKNGVITAYQSPDGGNFMPFGSLPDPFTGSVYVGLAVSSEIFTEGNIAQFRSVTLTTP